MVSLLFSPAAWIFSRPGCMRKESRPSSPHCHGPSKATHRLRLKLEQPAAVLGSHDPRAVIESGRVQLGRPHALCALGVLGLEPGVHTLYVVGGKRVTRQRELLSLVSGVRHVMYYNALYGARCNAHV